MADGVYDDEPTEEELNILEQAEGAAPPPPDDQEGAPAPEPKVEPAAEPAATEPASTEPAEPAAGDEDEWSQFLKRHEGKTPEEIAKLAFQQQKRANRAEFDGRKTSENLKTVLDKIAEAREKRLGELGERREAFKAKVENDPDAALLEAREGQLTAEEQRIKDEADAAEFNARATAAIELASAAIPNFAQEAPRIRDFGKELGFSDDEVGQITDGRQIIALHLAGIAGRMIMAGIIDPSGRFVNLPQPATETAPAAPARPGFGKAPARGAQGGKTVEQQLADISSMSDADFDKLDPAVLAELLKAAEQA